MHKVYHCFYGILPVCVDFERNVNVLSKLNLPEFILPEKAVRGGIFMPQIDMKLCFIKIYLCDFLIVVAVSF